MWVQINTTSYETLTFNMHMTRCSDASGCSRYQKFNDISKIITLGELERCPMIILLFLWVAIRI